MRNNLERIGVPQQGTDQAMQSADPTQQLNFIVPTEFVSLPSKGKYYQQNHPLYNKESIEIKQMTAKEEDILTSRNLLKKGVALDKLIQSLIVDKSINTDSITIEDRSAIILAARISGYGAEYVTTVNCPNCNAKNKNTFNLLEKLDSVENLPTPEVDEEGLFTVVLPKTKWAVKCRALNGYDEKAIMRLSESKKNLSEGDSLLTQQLKMTVLAINGITDKGTLEVAIENMPASDSKFLRNTYQDALKGVDMRHKFLCKSCDYEGEVEVPLSADFFWFK